MHMKAVRIHEFGGVDRLQYEDAPRPDAVDGQVLVRVHAAGVNPIDWKIRSGFFPGAGAHFPITVGNDIAGIVDSVGAGVTRFAPGDAVIALSNGGYAQYAAVQEEELAHKPESLDFVTAAAIPVASLTAWQALFDNAGLRSGQSVLIHAGAGGVGSFAIQFAKREGAHVLSTASAGNLDYLRELGADEAIDYGSVRFEDVAHDVDVVFDTIGGETQERSWQVLKPGGILVSIVQPIPEGKAEALGVRGAFMIAAHRGDQLESIAKLVAEGRIKVTIDRVYPLTDASKAHEQSEGHHTRGKIVLTVD